jgi:hypothetical protein
LTVADPFVIIFQPRKTRKRGDDLKRVTLFLSGLIFLTGCSGFSLGAKEFPLSPVSSQAYQIDPLLLTDPSAIHPAPPSQMFGLLEESSVPIPQAPVRSAKEDPIELKRTVSSQTLLTVEESREGQCPFLFSALDPSIDRNRTTVEKSLEKGISAYSQPVSTTGEGHSDEERTTFEALLQKFEEQGTPSEGEPKDSIGVSPEVLNDPSVLYEPERPAGAGSKENGILAGPSKPKGIPSISLVLNERVGEFIDFFQTKADSFFARALARSQAYAEMMKTIFREKDLPEELFYLALIESGYNPKAFSRAKASGIWQFIAKTGKQYGLQIDKWVDERRDPEKSTYAAARYLKDLYGTFNCWDLAAASYNAGEGKVMRAMQKTKSQDFWEISRSRHLKRETKEYVPMFRAAALIAKEPEKYGFTNIAYHPPLLYEKVSVPPATSLARVAKAAETDLAEIQDLNPALKQGKTPPNGRLFEVKIPPGKRDIFKKNFYAVPSDGKAHKVCKGETLSHIAKKYHVGIAEICARNAISAQTRLKPGMKIVLPQ